MMFTKLSNKDSVKKILVISLSNIGDVVLTFPVIDILKKDFPTARLSVVVGPKAEALLKGNPYIHRLHVFDKRQSIVKLIAWVGSLRRERFDLVVDLRHTAIPYMIGPRLRTAHRSRRNATMHMRDKHLNHLMTVYDFPANQYERCALFISAKDEAYADDLIRANIASPHFIILAPGAADSAKRWPEENFAHLADSLNSNHRKIVFVGSEGDQVVVQNIISRMNTEAVDLCGRTNLVQLAHLFKRCQFALVNDSAPMHLASYVGTPVLALFGPTEPINYGPWNHSSGYIRHNTQCAACAKPKKGISHSCMAAISCADVSSRIENALMNNPPDFHNE